MSDIVPDAELDCIGLYCPLPIARTQEEIDNIGVGQVLLVETDDPASEGWVASLEDALLQPGG